MAVMGWRLAGLAVLCLALGACGITVEKVPVATPLPVPDEARAVPIRFGKMQVRMRRGTPIQDTDVWSLDCAGPYDQVTWTRGRNHLQGLAWRDLFHEELRASGYDVTGDPARLHDEDEEDLRAEWVVSAQITDLKVQTCEKQPLLFGLVARKGMTAEAAVQVDWTVYSRLERKLVMRASTKGSAESDRPTVDGDLIAVEQAFAAAVANLAADPAFHAAAFERRAPRRAPAAAGEEEVGPVGEVSTDGALLLPRLDLHRGPLQGRAEGVAAAAVVVSGGRGHGSGVIVAPEGWILTNFHVVGEAEQVRVRLADGRALVGRVARRHPARDVALVKVEGAGLPALPLRERDLVLSEDVYAIGAPQSERLRGTVSRGIVSGFRRDPATRLRMVQADVPIFGGSSGGPLVDGSGNLAGLAVAGYANTTLNFFIPVADALGKLEVSLGPRP